MYNSHHYLMTLTLKFKNGYMLFFHLVMLSNCIKHLKASKTMDCPYEWQLGASKIWPLGHNVSRHKYEVNMLTCKKCLDLSDLAHVDTKYHLEACRLHTLCSPNHLQTLFHIVHVALSSKATKKGFHSPAFQ